MRDAIYTPPDLADRLVQLVPDHFDPRSIADFSAGEGALIDSALRAFRPDRLIVNDVCGNAFNYLNAKYPQQIIRSFDAEAKNQVYSVENGLFVRCADLVLANPPFSSKGNRAHECEIGERQFRASRALSFVANWLPAVRPGGLLLAILPSGSLTNIRDQELLKEIKKNWVCEVERILSRSLFPKKSVEVVLTSWRKKVNATFVPRLEKKIINKRPKTHDLRDRISIFRGRLPMHKLNLLENERSEDAVTLVHTTDLKQLTLGGSTTTRLVQKRSCLTSLIHGPAILIPRVGLPRVQCFPIIPEGESVALSDCVIGLKTFSNSEAKKIRSTIEVNWASFSGLYNGSCAKFVTLKSLRSWIDEWFRDV